MVRDPHHDIASKKSRLQLLTFKLSNYIYMTEIKDLTAKIKKFRDQRDWKQFHTLKNIAEAMVIEAAEVLELFQWKSEEEVKKYAEEHKKEIGDELSDVLVNILELADELGIDIVKACEEKMRDTSKKYPADKVKGDSRKYNQY